MLQEIMALKGGNMMMMMMIQNHCILLFIFLTMREVNKCSKSKGNRMRSMILSVVLAGVCVTHNAYGWKPGENIQKVGSKISQTFQTVAQIVDDLSLITSIKADDVTTAALVANRLNANRKDEAGMTPLHLLAQGHMRDKASREKFALLLIQVGARIDEVNNDGAPALLTAIASNNPGMALLLINNGANVKLASPDGRTPLILLGQRGIKDEAASAQLATALISKGADVNKVDSNGKTALWYAIKKNIPSLATVLINANAKR